MEERVLNIIDALQQQIWCCYLIALDEEDIKNIINCLINACVYATASIIIRLKTSVPEGVVSKIGIDMEKEAIWALYQNAKEQ